MNNFSFILTTLLLILFTLPCQSQNISLEKNGYIILESNNEKIEGIIQNGDWKITPDEITFGSEKTVYKKEQLKGFGVYQEDGILESYVKHMVDIEISPYSKTNVNCNNSIELEKQEVFLRILQKGDFSLYQYINTNRYHYFIQQKDEPVKTLIYKRFFDCDESARPIIDKNVFQQQLSQLFKDCSELSKKDFTKTKYDAISLTNLLGKYNECTSANIDVGYTKRKKRIKIQGYTSLGGISTTYKRVILSSNDIQKNKTIPTFSLGLRSEYLLPKNNNSLSIIFGINYRYGNSKDLTFAKDFTLSTEENARNIEVMLLLRKYFKKAPNFSLGLGAFYVNNRQEDILAVNRMGLRAEFYLSLGKFDIIPSYSFSYGSLVELDTNFRNHAIDLAVSYTIFDTKNKWDKK